MDVYEIEPLPADSPLLHIDSLTLTPHLGAMAADTFAPTVRRMFANITRVSRGEPLPALDAVVPQPPDPHMSCRSEPEPRRTFCTGPEATRPASHIDTAKPID